MLRFTVGCSLTLGLLAIAGCGDDAPPDNGGKSGASGSAGASTSGAAGAAGAAASGASNGGGSSGRKKAGDPCTTNDECPVLGLTEPLCRTEWPGGGYCMTDTCTGPQNCVDEATCGTVEGEKHCLRSCDNPEQCRDGYTCEQQVCVPAQ